MLGQLRLGFRQLCVVFFLQLRRAITRGVSRQVLPHPARRASSSSNNHAFPPATSFQDSVHRPRSTQREHSRTTTLLTVLIVRFLLRSNSITQQNIRSEISAKKMSRRVCFVFAEPIFFQHKKNNVRSHSPTCTGTVGTAHDKCRSFHKITTPVVRHFFDVDFLKSTGLVTR